MAYFSQFWPIFPSFDLKVTAQRYNLMHYIGKALNIKAHVVGADKSGEGGKLIYGPGDIEGKRVKK